MFPKKRHKSVRKQVLQIVLNALIAPWDNEFFV